MLIVMSLPYDLYTHIICHFLFGFQKKKIQMTYNFYGQKLKSKCLEEK